MYACSPRWKDDWISREDLVKILEGLSTRIQGSSLGSDRVGVNYGLHFTGGEPFLNFDLLVEAVRAAGDLHIPSTFVETNGFWATNDRETRDKLRRLKEAGLHGILVSVNPFILEQVPFERTERAAKMSVEVFPGNMLLYQQFFSEQFKSLGIKGVLPFKDYVQRVSLADLYGNVELLPMGRACSTLGHLFPRYPARQFLGESCHEELTRGWHIHVDNYGNYMTGYCAGISLGDGRNIDSICEGVDLDERPIVGALATRLETFLELGVREYGYTLREDGYMSKCHLCLDVRKHIVQQTDEFLELRPREFYDHLD